MKKILLLNFLFISYAALAQQFGGNPPSVSWKQINNKAVRVIFPTGMDSQAMRIASIIDYLAINKPDSLGNKLKKVNLVLQNSTVVSNAYVGLGPFRSEFFTTPPSNNFEQGSIPWNDQLALHEYRHVMQYNNFNRGLSKTLHTLLGDDGLSLATNAAIPDWFFEGDAVFNETVLSKQGRGRLPLFMNAYPTLWQANKKYSWMKLRNGSLKDYVPDHYQLGYLLVNYGHQKYGDDFWKNVMQHAASWKNLIYPFQSAVKKYAGVEYKTFTQQAFASVQKNTEKLNEEASDFLFPVNKKYITNYYFPYSVGNDSLIYLKTSYRQRPAFYVKDKSGEHKIKLRDISIDEQYGYNDGKIVYAAYQKDPRWGWVDYSVIKVLDIRTGEEKQLTHKSKYFSPDITEDGTLIAAVQNEPNGKSEIHILNTANGEVIQKIKSGAIIQFTDPKFADDNNLVSIVKLKNGEMALALAEISTGNTIRLTPPSVMVSGFPFVKDGYVYFTAGYDGDDNIYALRLKDKKIFKLTTGQSGKYFANTGNGNLTWSEFTAEGYQLRQEKLDMSKWEEVNAENIISPVEKFPVYLPSGISNILSHKISEKNYSISKYKKGTQLFNFHSWRPYYEDPVFSYAVYGENLLNTFQSELYYQYNQNEKTNAAGAAFVYSALYPQLSVGSQYTFNRHTITGNKTRYWDQLDTYAGLNIPLHFVKGKTFRNFNMGTNYVFRNDNNKGFFKDSMGNIQLQYLHHFISWSQYVPQARQHIFPRLGYSFSLADRYAVSNKKGNQLLANASVYLPGLLKNHSLVLNAAFQQRDTLGQVVFSDRFAYSRGFTGRYFSRMWKLAANYHFPLLYPDWGFGNILYINQIRANTFFDFTKVYSKDKSQTVNQRSVGGEIYFDTRWWNQYPLTFGFRVSHLLDRDQFDLSRGTLFEVILPVSIIPR
ncbi:MAG TPA: hypothetical protein PK275_08880 [Chitinophagaceae bacterium]|nr:hypothetical protein [Chitinophagaceae bacterium]